MPNTIHQAGAIPYFIDGDKLKFVLITPKDFDQVWIMPKGHIEPKLGPAKSAAMEALEEAGVRGNTSEKPIGTYYYQKNGTRREVKMYLLEVTEILDTWEEVDLRKRKIVKRKKAMDLIFYKSIAKMIKKIKL